MGLDVNLKGVEEIKKSSMYPEHGWSPTYLRSSYNPRGFNNVVGNLTGLDLYTVFQPNDNYKFKPNWEEALRGAHTLLNTLSEEVKHLPYVAEFEHSQDLRPQGGVIDSHQKALSHLKTELFRVNKSEVGFNPYSNAKGIFYLKEPLEVTALVKGTLFGKEGFYIICKQDFTYYLQAAEILVKEFIPLGLSNKGTSYLTWSG